MRPAFSVVFLTTLIGIGQGLLLALVAGQFYWIIGATDAQEDSHFYALGSAIALAFLVIGLAASFWHLAHPERAWRAISQWRTSWLSREVILLPAVMGLVVLYGGLHLLGINPTLITFSNLKTLDLTMAVGYVAAAATVLLFVVTGMIYACLKFIQEWASPLTVINFSLIGTASGAVVATAYAALAASPLIDIYAAATVVLLVAALVGRLAALWRNARLRRISTPQTAIGVHHRSVRQLTQGFLAGSFNTREFFHGKSPHQVFLMRWVFVILGFAIPLVLVLIGWIAQSTLLLIVAVVIQYPGLVIERWVFFADAHHPQNLYYQRAA